MAEKVLKIKTVSEVAEAISGLTDLQGSLKGVGTAAIEASGKAKGEWAAFDAKLKETNPTLKGVSASAFEVEKALNSMGRATSTSQLESGLVKSQVALNQFKAKLDEVRAAGGTIDSGMTASFAVMQKSIDAGKAKLDAMHEATTRAKEQLGMLAVSQKAVADSGNIFATVLGKTSVAANGAAGASSGLGKEVTQIGKGMMAASGAVGPFGELLEKLSANLTPAQSKLAELGFKVVAAGAAFKVGYDAGTKFNEFLQQHGNYLEKAIDGTVNFVTGLKSEKELLSALPIAMNAVLHGQQQMTAERAATLKELQAEAGGWQDLDKVRKDAIERAKSISERYTQLKASGKDWRGEIEQQAPAINANTAALQRLGVQFKDLPYGYEQAAKHAAEFELRLKAAENAARLTGIGVRGLRDTLEALPTNLKDFTLPEVIDGLAKSIASAKAEGKDWNVILSDYAPELEKLRKAAIDAGVEGIDLFRTKILDLLPAHDAAIIAIGEQAAATEQALARMNAAADAAYQAKLDRWAREDAAANRTSKAPEEYKAIQDAAFGAAVANGELGTNLDRVAEAVVATGGTMTVGAPIWITIAQATEEQTAALLRQAEAWGILTSAQLEHMSATKGWTDQVIAMQQAYENGTSSLYNYITGLEDFKNQLLTMYAGATGAAKEAVDAMVAMIEKLMQTAGGRDTGSGNTNVDNLNRALEEERRRNGGQ